MNTIQDIWLKFNKLSNKLTEALGSTNNFVGEYSEFLAHCYYGGTKLKPSSASADLETPDGKRYQIKSRKINRNLTTQLNVIRSLDFDYLVVILFNRDGTLAKALEIPVEIVKKIAKYNRHQNGFILTTTQSLLHHPLCKDLTHSFLQLPAKAVPEIKIDKPHVTKTMDIRKNKNKLTKAEAILILKCKSKSPGIHFANVNKVAPVWWLDIPKKEIDSEKIEIITFILVNAKTDMIHVLDVPTRFLRANKSRLLLWKKKSGAFYSFALATDQRKLFMNLKPISSKLSLAGFLKKSVNI